MTLSTMTPQERAELLALIWAMIWAGVQVAFWGLLLVGFISTL